MPDPLQALTEKDFKRMARSVKDFESRPGPRPVAEQSGAVIGASRVLIAVPRVAEDGDGYCLGDLYIHDTSDNTYELLSEDTVLIAVLPDTL